MLQTLQLMVNRNKVTTNQPNQSTLKQRVVKNIADIDRVFEAPENYDNAGRPLVITSTKKDLHHTLNSTYKKVTHILLDKVF
ncbi:hypothetical protein NAF29_05565 [Echinimonas agarilytica]|uniref:Uncharacterized protein n=1 Tax=Echinimonas agarilytica TaxID=1215918 RepID=A0AA41W526_9GAMM|nr:hypothetical protein [Echinimonas agarilytica]